MISSGIWSYLQISFAWPPQCNKLMQKQSTIVDGRLATQMAISWQIRVDICLSRLSGKMWWQYCKVYLAEVYLSWVGGNLLLTSASGWRNISTLQLRVGRDCGFFGLFMLFWNFVYFVMVLMTPLYLVCNDVLWLKLAVFVVSWYLLTVVFMSINSIV